MVFMNAAIVYNKQNKNVLDRVLDSVLDLGQQIYLSVKSKA